VSTTFSSALGAARQAAAAQHYPHSALYVVATPIGNLADISLRALHVLELADFVACEDTRHTLAMLRAYGIDKRSSQLLAVHQHNEAEAAQSVLAHLQRGARVAYASDAGTPAISDPGARLVALVQSQGLRAIALPGASSVTAALSVAGLAAAGEHGSGFVFLGFLPGKAGERARAVQSLATQALAVVLLEAPHRMEALARELAALTPRSITVCRELTKQFEEVTTIDVAALVNWLAEDANRLRGEYVLVLHAASAPAHPQTDNHVLQLLLAHLPLKTAVRLCADITGKPRNELYAQALALRPGEQADTPSARAHGQT
jgi:16S rRNA (cytidine1402-2'-O)-methyltransferase